MPSIEPESQTKQTIQDVEDKRTKSQPSAHHEKDEEIELTRDSRELGRPNRVADETVGKPHASALKDKSKSAFSQPMRTKGGSDAPITQSSVSGLKQRFETAPPEPAQSNGVTDAPITKGNVHTRRAEWDAIIEKSQESSRQRGTNGGNSGKPYNTPGKKHT